MQLGIRNQLLTPTLVLLVLASVAGILAINRAFDRLAALEQGMAIQTNQASVEAFTENKVKEVYNSIEQLGHKGLEEVALFSRMPEVQEAYALALTGKIDDEADPVVQQARALLRKRFAPILEGYKEQTGEVFQLHFHLPNARSLARLWRAGWQVERGGKRLDISDDISGFRKTVVQVNRDHRPITGIEVGKGGFEIRGLVPVTGTAGQHLGSAEILVPFDSLLKGLMGSKSSQYAVYMNADSLKVATELRNPTEHPVLEGRHVLVTATDRAMTDRLVTAAFLDGAREAPVSWGSQGFSATAFPIHDYSGKQAGTMVFTIDLHAQEAIVDKAIGESASALSALNRRLIAGTLVFILAVAGLSFFTITRFLVRPLRDATVVATAIARGDMQVGMEERGAIELRTLARSFNAMVDSLKEKSQVAASIAAGDLGVQVGIASEQDRLGRALGGMAAHLRSTVSQLQVVGAQIATGSSEVSAAAQSVSQGATEQASSVEQITASMTEMVSRVRQSAESAALANKLATEARDAAGRGNAQMQQMVQAMGEISAASQSMSGVLKSIDAIAFQTNLLALNAAVEAARAGVHGKGFAVVAEEVRSLAAKSAKAARESAALIEGSVAKAQSGAQIAQKTAEALGEIVSGTTRAAGLVAEIATHSDEQSRGIAMVNQGLAHIDRATQQSAASAEQSAAAAGELSSQAVHLERMLKHFRLESAP